MPRRAPLPALPELFVGSAATAVGDLTPGQLRGPRLRRVVHDVYAPSSLTITHEVRCRAVAMVSDSSTVITGRSAATVHGVDLARAGDPVELLSTDSSRRLRRPGLQVRATIHPVESVPWRGVRLATPRQAALDIARRGDVPWSVGEVDRMVRAGLLSRTVLQSYLLGRHDHGIGAAREVVELLDPRSESVPESVVRVLLAQEGLNPVPQHVVRDVRGVVGAVDLAFPDQKVVVEYDGKWHGSPFRVGRDRERLQRLEAAGWVVVFVTAEDLGRPDQICGRVRAALARR
jgi:very-short-patch-repair endonuclease